MCGVTYPGQQIGSNLQINLRSAWLAYRIDQDGLAKNLFQLNGSLMVRLSAIVAATASLKMMSSL